MCILLLLVNMRPIIDFNRSTDINTDGCTSYCEAVICQLVFSRLPGTLLQKETLTFCLKHATGEGRLHASNFTAPSLSHAGVLERNRKAVSQSGSPQFLHFDLRS